MMGYGQPHNTVKEVATPLSARALFLQDHLKKNLLIVHLEQAFVTMAIKEEVLKRLTNSHPEWKITEASLLMIAQHTHSAPGGYSHYPMYNFTIPGFNLTVFHKIVGGVMEAIELAYKDLAPSELSYGEIDIAPEKEVAFNRSLHSHQNNTETPRLRPEEKNLAVDRKMKGLKISREGKLRGIINWFGVHATSISSFNHRIHYDNKGVAAALFEKNYPGTIALFAQESAGDISPNFRWDKKLNRMVGKFNDQYENAEFNGEIQFREAEKISYEKSLQGEIKSLHTFVDVTKLTTAPAHGVAFFEGTLEGPGVPPALASILKVVSRTVKKINLMKNPELHQKFYEEHAPKDVLLDHRNGSFLGIPLGVWKKLPPLPDPTVEFFRKDAKSGSVDTLPWVPPILPFQLIFLGPLLIICVPGEITVTAGNRLKNFLKHELLGHGIEEIIISSYANCYMGYITTPQEYETQSYEAGHTVYGRNTLSAIFTGFGELVREFKDFNYNRTLNTPPFHYPPEELAKRTVSSK